MRKVMTIAVLTFVALAVPTAGMAVSVSSSDGSGTQTVKTQYANGAYLDGTLKSAAGSPVYYSGLVVINNCSDYNDGRYTGNVTSKTGQGAGGDVTSPPPIVWPCSLDGERRPGSARTSTTCRTRVEAGRRLFRSDPVKV